MKLNDPLKDLPASMDSIHISIILQKDSFRNVRLKRKCQRPAPDSRKRLSRDAPKIQRSPTLDPLPPSDK